MKITIRNCYLTAALAIALPMATYAQTDSTSQVTSDITELSLEDLMSVKIVSASRTEEKVFDAPLSSFVITRKEIFNSGSTSIPAALRLCPGLFVKEMSNGVYDVTIRGLDNLPTHQFVNTNKLILVMIDNRPVFDYLQGGTFWQNLPIDIIDVERIEVVLGPSAPLYGPNAVEGVINIITKKVSKDGVTISAHTQAGSTDSYISQAYVGYRVNPKLDISGSLNFNHRGRYAKEYFDSTGTGGFVTDPSKAFAISNPVTFGQVYPDPTLAMKKTAGNLNLNYKPSDDVNLLVAGGFNSNYSLYGISAVSTQNYFSNNSWYSMVKGDVKGFSVLGSILRGTQGIVGDLKSYQYDYQNIDAYIDYHIKVTDKFNIRPAINFQQASINDRPYTTEKGLTGIFNNKADMYNIGASLKADYTLGKFRFIGAIRGDKFKFPEKLYISYQGIVNFKLNDKNIFRAMIARSNSGSFMNETYINVQVANIPANPPYQPAVKVWQRGSKDRKLISNAVYELGYRSQILDNLQLDIAYFHQQADGFTAPILQAPQLNMATFTVNTDIVFSNIDLKAIQNGVTLALNWAALDNTFNFKPFVTFQSTQLKNYSPYYITPEAATASSQYPAYNIANQNNIDGKSTPNVYGGFYANYAPGKWNFNVNGYYMTKYEVYTYTSTQNKVRPYKEFDASKISDKFILNLRVAYKLNENVSLFANARNTFNATGREFFATDKIGAMYLGGLHIDY